MKLHRMTTAVLVAGLVATASVSIAAGGPAAAKQRVAIEGRYDTTTGTNRFTLLTLSAGSLRRDSGSGRGYGKLKPSRVLANGQRVTPVRGGDRFKGRFGELVVTEQVESRDAGRSYSADLGTWSVTGGTGAYAGLEGGGGFAAVGLPNGDLLFRMEGYVVGK